MNQILPHAIQEGDRRALSQALTAIENNEPEGQQILTALFPITGRAHLVGVTGAPGTGKSTLVNQLAKSIHQREKAQKIAVIAVDPTSPFSGGALLGDRIRMRDLAGNRDIFIRSMASRGALGGLAHATAAFATLLDAAGYELILIETVGAGQAEVEIARLAHTVIVVDAPGLGDDIQAIKAGILEIADILVVNKADQAGAENTARALKIMLEMAQGKGSMPTAGKHMRAVSRPVKQPEDNDPTGWQTPVLMVTATEGEGVGELVEKIDQHRAFLHKEGLWEVKEAYRLRQDLIALIQDSLVRHWEAQVDPEVFDAVLNDVIKRKYSPLEAVEKLLTIK